MKSLNSIFNDTDKVQDFSKNYFKYIAGLMDRLDKDAIAAFIEELEDARRKGNAIFFIGNGGSAAAASHMVNDLSLGSRTFDDSMPFRALALTDNTAVMTAIANDCGYADVFTSQLKVQYRKSDILVAISASGNSVNIINAATWVKKQGGKVIGLVGFDGGKLKDMCDIVIHVNTPNGEYGPVEDIHAILGHLIYTWLWYEKRQGIKK